MSRPSQLLRRGITSFAAALCVALISMSTALAANYDYTDNWVTSGESGWGVNFTQSDNFIFATFFIYGPDKKPTWYTGQMTWDGTSQFTGGLYLTGGTYYINPWNTGDSPAVQSVGTATFIPSTSNNFQGTLTYTVNGVGTVTKQVQRLTLTSILLAANYVGGQSGAYSSCTASASNSNYIDFFTLQVTQSGTSVSMLFTYPDDTLNADNTEYNCTFAGTLSQTGQIYSIINGTYQCSDGLNTFASLYNLRATPLGIEGQYSAPSVGGGCREDAQFSGTLN
jgi:hypothetical protein